MQELKIWLDRFVSEYTVLTDNLVNIVGLGDCLLISEKNGKIFDSELHPILSDAEHEILDKGEVKNLVLKFGSNYFHTDLSIFERFGVVGNAENNFNFLKYFGKKEQVMDWPYLGVRGSYEILNGVFHYEEWVKKADFLGVKVLGICEKNTLGGVLKFQLACKKKDIKPIIGATYSIKDDRSSWDFKLYVKNKEGWKNLLLINSTVRVLNDQPFLSLEDLEGLNEGLVFVFCPSQLKFDKLLINKVKKVFSDIYYQIDDLDFISEERDQEYLSNLKLWKDSSGLKPVLICDSHYLEPEHQDLYDSLNKLGGQSNSSLKGTKHFKDLEEVILNLVTLFKTEDDCLDFISECVENTTELSDLCNFKIPTSDWHIPQYKMSKEELGKYKTNENMFLSLIEEGLQNYRKEKGEKWWVEHEEEYRDRIKIETELILFGQIVDYFLLLWGVVQFSNREGILVGNGRGSAAGALTAYLLGITKVDSIEWDLLFERFLTKGRLIDEKGNRVSLPDIDIDFSGDRRDEVKKFLETTYGEERVCSVGTYTSLQLKAAIKDLGRVKGLDQESYNTFVKIMDLSTSDSRKIFHWTEVFKQAVEKDFIKNFVQKNPDIIEFTMECIGQEKAASVHPCATIVLPEGYNIYETFPVRMGEVSGHRMLVSEWEGDMLEKAGFLKEDILGILQLTKFAMIQKLVKEQLGEDVDVFKVPLDVPEVMDLFCKGFSSDIFQFQSQTLTNYTLQVQPRSVEELSLINAIVRPGPMDNGFHTDYVAIKRGEKEESYLSSDIKKILGSTKGLIVYQEQVMKVTQQIGGLTLSEADEVRRAMGKLDYKYLSGFLPRFLEGGKDKGYKTKDLEELWEQMSKFCRYAYNRSHAVCYALTAYSSQYLKWKYPIQFWTTAFEYESDDLKIQRYISEIYKSGSIKLFGPDINHSKTVFTSDYKKNEIYWTLSKVRNCGDVATTSILEERDKNGEFFSLEDFIDRVPKDKVNKSVVENLIFSGAFDKLENIKFVSDRIRLIKKFRELRGVKVDKEDFVEQSIKSGIVETDWWWLLLQKHVSGFAFFNYEDFIYDNEEWKAMKLPFLSPETLHQTDYTSDYTTNKSKVLTAGIIQEIDVRESSIGEEFARILIENNYTTAWVYLRGFDNWPKNKEYILGTGKGSLIILNAIAIYNKWTGQNVFQTVKDFSCEILTMK